MEAGSAPAPRRAHGLLWLAASLPVLVCWGLLGLIPLWVAAEALMPSAASEAPLWVAYLALAFTSLLWPLLLLIASRRLEALNRGLCWMLVGYAALNLVFSASAALGWRLTNSQFVFAGQDISSPATGFLTSALMLLAVGASAGLTRASLVSLCPHGLPDESRVGSDPAAE